MRKEFELTESQMSELLNASKPTLAIALQCGAPPSPQETANAWWKKLGTELGFDYLTARPSERGVRFFTAEITATALAEDTFARIDKSNAARDAFARR